MNILSLSLSGLRHNCLSNIFNILVLALGIAVIVTLVNVSGQVERRFENDLAGIDLVVGAKGSPVQLMLSSIFHMDAPNGNISLTEAEKITRNKMVKSAVPVALGDNFSGYRIVGTNADYLKLYNGTLASGRIFNAPMEAVAGSEVAAKRSLKINDRIVGAHGLVSSDDLHKDFPYTIVGILAPSGTVLDRLVLTPVESVWRVHEHPEPDDKSEVEKQKEHPGKEITALLVSYRSPLATATLPRMINQSSAMQAASPATELARLIKMLGIGGDAIQAFGGALVVIAAVGFFMTLFNAVNERRYDIALLRVLGATRSKVFAFVLAEGLMLGVAGTVLGVILGQALSYAVELWIETTKHITLGGTGFNPYEILAGVGAIALSCLASIIPAFMAYRVNVAQVLSRG